MKLPKLTLGGKKWTYRRPMKVIVDGAEALGSCCRETRTIEVRKDLNGEEELITDLHEIRHALNDYLDDDYVESESQETAVALRVLGYRKLAPAEITALEKLRDG